MREGERRRNTVGPSRGNERQRLFSRGYERRRASRPAAACPTSPRGPRCSRTTMRRNVDRATDGGGNDGCESIASRPSASDRVCTARRHSFAVKSRTRATACRALRMIQLLPQKNSRDVSTAIYRMLTYSRGLRPSICTASAGALRNQMSHGRRLPLPLAVRRNVRGRGNAEYTPLVAFLCRKRSGAPISIRRRSRRGPWTATKRPCIPGNGGGSVFFAVICVSKTEKSLGVEAGYF